jgi:hypothetical protein
VTLQVNRYLPSEMKVQPLPTGGIADGWLQVVFRDITRDALMSSHGTLRVGFVDAIEGKSHYIGIDLDKVHGSLGMLPSEIRGR